MLVTISASLPPEADCRIFPIAKNAAISPPLEAAGLIAEAAAASRFTGEAGSWFETFVAEAGVTRRIALVGTGSVSSADLEKAGATITARLMTSGVRQAALVAEGVSAANVGALALGARLRAWRIDTYRTKVPETAKPTLETVTIVSAVKPKDPAMVQSEAVAAGVGFARELVSEPGNVIYPESFVERCRSLAGLGLEVSVLDENDIAALGMGALLGVAQGSMRKPRLLALRWDGSAGVQASPLALVGKGVTFDTGGISLKPGAGMEDMKFDMGGAAAVVGTMIALAQRKARAHVVGVCGLVENMPDGNAQRPGDIVKSMSGQTIEVLNTDAEGRLVLADTMWWTQKTYAPKTLIDLATLTGAMVAALADQYGGLFANDDALAEKLIAAGDVSGDRLWRFPLGEAFDKMIDSPIADMKNMGARYGGAITAAQFIKRFVQDGVSWAHLDIAGMVWADKPGTLWDKGATGYGVRLLDRLVADNYETA
jgi:leucyl aminopeptidase